MLDILTAAKSHVKTEKIKVTDYQSLVDFLINDELNQEIVQLKQLLTNLSLSEIEKQEQFKVLCAKRVHYFNCYGECNKLYWKTAEFLFKPKNLQQMLAIVLPNIKVGIEPTVTHLSKAAAKLSGRHFEVKLEQKSLKDLDSLQRENLDISQLNRFIITPNGILFPLEEIDRFSYELHVELHSHLKDNHPTLFNLFYSHNADLSLLKVNLEVSYQKALTPRQAISQLKTQLENSGEKRSGLTYARPLANKAFKRFILYIQSLPEKLRKDLQSVQQLTKVIDDLDHGQCVEMAAKDLAAILIDSSNAKLLDTLPRFTQTDLQKLREKYQYEINNSLNITGDNQTYVIPHDLMDRIELTDTDSYIAVLQAFPIAKYETLFEKVQVNSAFPRRLFEIMSIDNLDPAKIIAFSTTVIQHAKKFGGFEAIFQSLLSSYNDKIFEILLNSILRLPIEDKVDGLNSLLIQILYHPEKEKKLAWMKLILNAPSLNDIQRAKIIFSSQNFIAAPVWHIMNLEMVEFQKVLDTFTDKLALLKMQNNNNGNTLLHIALKNNNKFIVKKVWDIFIECKDVKEQIAILNLKNKEGDIPLQVAANLRDENLLTAILKFHTANADFPILEPDLAQRLLHLLLDNKMFDYFTQILSKFPQEKQVEILFQSANTNKTTTTMLHKLAQNSTSTFTKFLPLLSTLPADKREAALTQAGIFGNFLLLTLLSNNETNTFNQVLNFLTPEQIKGFIKSNPRGNDLLQQAFNNNKDIFGYILSFFNKEEQKELLFQRRFSLINLALENKDLAKINQILSYFTATERQTVFTKKILDEIRKIFASDSKFATEYPEDTLYRYAIDQRSVLNKAYSKFINNDKPPLNNIIAVLNNLVNPRGGIFNIHKNRDFLDEADALLRKLNQLNKSPSDAREGDVLKLLGEAYHSVISKPNDKKNKFEATSFLRRLAFCYFLAVKQENPELESSNRININSI